MTANFTPLPERPVGLGGSPEMRESSPAQAIESAPAIEASITSSPVNSTPQQSDMAVDDITLPQDIIQAGRESSGDLEEVGEPLMDLPLTDEEIFKSKKEVITSPLRWLGEWCLYLLKKGHLTLKKIHGHITRIPMPNI